MSKHAKLWTRKRQELSEREEALKKELEDVSNLFEGRAKAILFISLATGGAFLIFYLIYKSFSRLKPEIAADPVNVKVKKPPKRTVLKTLITERILSALLAYLGHQLGQSMKTESKGKKNKG
ncbi:hypothetical protein [Marinoscillum sp. MHG1-6]|uniref:hypothetical protein n=1 Tax=Marinoscillum sp. MHG1-6 TaxID=2959627 RepID=UPI0021587C7B|nr:hypothetical protein [Marinoscillum sp. MHG1-6]